MINNPGGSFQAVLRIFFVRLGENHDKRLIEFTLTLSMASKSTIIPLLISSSLLAQLDSYAYIHCILFVHRQDWYELKFWHLLDHLWLSWLQRNIFF